MFNYIVTVAILYSLTIVTNLCILSGWKEPVITPTVRALRIIVCIGMLMWGVVVLLSNTP